MGGPATIDGIVYPVTDNFWECSFKVNGKEYCSAENYFQSCKTTNEADHEFVRKSGPGMEAWNAGCKIALRPDWEEVKVNYMYEANYNKFTQNKELADTLIGTKGEIYFGTGFWGKWNGVVLTRIRAELRNEKEDHEVAENMKKEMRDYYLSSGNKKD